MMLFELGEERHIGASLKVIGVGGAGGNAVNAMIMADVKGVDFIAANTDLQALESSRAPIKLQLGAKLTKGLGTGANPELGRKSAMEDADRLSELMVDSDMVFITAGMGGGTGTGAAPVIAKIARDCGALTVGVVTKPFLFEGKKRLLQAEDGLRELKEACDTVITIPNQRLMSVVARTTTLSEAFNIANDVLRQAVEGISNLVTKPGLINLDFADIRTIMAEMGMALMGTGEGSGESRAIDAAQRAISSPLLEEASIDGARGVLFNVTGGPDITLHEINEAAQLIHEAAHEDAHIMFGAVIEESLQGFVRVTVIATGFGERKASEPLLKSVVQEDLEIPTHIRRGHVSSGVSLPTSGALAYQAYEEDELDTPTFLRKKAD
ncbi:MAG: cell division protein FtsZ [Candidatus Tectomicrobia bacterium]|nr:cell division protein FtsZ [Candidatus Tectomicrobia bacterium]